jgi:hypothetical protein
VPALVPLPLHRPVADAGAQLVPHLPAPGCVITALLLGVLLVCTDIKRYAL